MSKFSKTLATSGLLVLSIGLAGCQNAAAPAAPQKAPEVVLQEGVSKLSEVTSYTYKLGVIGDLKGPTGNPPEKVTFNLDLNGSIDAKDTQDPKLNLNLKGDMMADSDGGSGELSFRMNKTAMYLNLMALEGKGSVTIPEEMKTQLIGKWWTMPVPPEALAELAKAVPQGDAANMTEEQKQLKTLVEQTKFFKNVEFKGMESVGGEQSYHYTGVLDKVAFADFVVKASEIQGQTISDEEKANMTKGFEMFDFSGDFYVGQSSGVLNKGKGTLTFKASEDGSTPSGNVSLEFMVSDLNKPVTVEVPADAQPVPMDAFNSLPL